MDPCYPGVWPPQNNIDIDPAPPYDARSSLANISVAEVLERYQHDTDLMKHILTAKSEEDKVKKKLLLLLLMLLRASEYKRE